MGFSLNNKAFLLSGMVATAALLTACGDKDVAAKVNGAPIYEAEINERMTELPANLVQGREDDVRRQLLEGLVQQAVIQQEAKKLNIDESDEFETAMAQAEQQIKARLVMKAKVDAAVTNEAVAAAYEANKQRLTFPAVKARHILVATEKEARDLIAIANPTNFASLATEKSIGPSKDQGGDLGWFRKEAMIPAFADVAFATPAGQVASTPVQTQFGWHVVLVEDKNDAYAPPLEAVQEQIRQQLSQEVMAGVMRDMRTSANVDYVDATLAPATQENQPTPAAGQ